LPNHLRILFFYLHTYFTHNSGREKQWHKRNRHDLVNYVCNAKLQTINKQYSRNICEAINVKRKPQLSVYR